MVQWKLPRRFPLGPVKRILIFLNPNFFIPDSKFPRPYAYDRIRIRPSFQGSSELKCLQSMRHRETRPAPCAAILIYRSLRDWTRFYCVIGLENIRIHLSTRYRIRCGFIFFPLWRADLKIHRFAVEFAGCVWTEAVSGKNKSQIQKYPDTCGPGISCSTRTRATFRRTMEIQDLYTKRSRA